MKKPHNKLCVRALALFMCGSLCAGMSGCSFSIGKKDDISGSEAQAPAGQEETDGLVTVIDGNDTDIIAYPTGEGADRKDSLSVTLAEFKKEYLYWLSSNSITDDSADLISEYCKERRESTINYLINEKIIFDQTDKLGITLTPDDLAAIEENYNAKIDSMLQTYVSKLTDNTLSEAEKLEQAGAALDMFLAACGMTRDDLLLWSRSAIITARVIREVTKDVKADRAEAEKTFADYVDAIKQLYEDDPDKYATDNYRVYWIPEGSRLIKDIHLKFSTDTINEITNLRENGKPDEAERVLVESLAAKEGLLSEITEKLESGADFNELLAEYAEVPADDPDGMFFVPKASNYPEKLMTAAFGLEAPGDFTAVSYDDGYHILYYSADAVVTEEQINEHIDTVYGVLQENAETSAFSDQLLKWQEEYAFSTDRALLKLD